MTIEATNLLSAEALCNALISFKPKLVGSEEVGFRVRVKVRGSDNAIVTLLNALEAHVVQRQRVAYLLLDGHPYTIHPH